MQLRSMVRVVNCFRSIKFTSEGVWLPVGSDVALRANATRLAEHEKTMSDGIVAATKASLPNGSAELEICPENNRRFTDKFLPLTWRIPPPFRSTRQPTLRRWIRRVPPRICVPLR